MWGHSNSLAALRKLLPLSVVRQLSCSGSSFHASSVDSSAEARFSPVWSSGQYMVLQTVALQFPVVPNKVDCAADVWLSCSARPEVCCCSKVLSMTRLMHHLFTGLCVQRRDCCVGEILARWQFVLQVECFQQFTKSWLFHQVDRHNIFGQAKCDRTRQLLPFSAVPRIRGHFREGARECLLLRATCTWQRMFRASCATNVALNTTVDGGVAVPQM